MMHDAKIIILRSLTIFGLSYIYINYIWFCSLQWIIQTEFERDGYREWDLKNITLKCSHYQREWDQVLECVTWVTLNRLIQITRLLYLVGLPYKHTVLHLHMSWLLHEEEGNLKSTEHILNILALNIFLDTGVPL